MRHLHKHPPQVQWVPVPPSPKGHFPAHRAPLGSCWGWAAELGASSLGTWCQSHQRRAVSCRHLHLPGHNRWTGCREGSGSWSSDCCCPWHSRLPNPALPLPASLAVCRSPSRRLASWDAPTGPGRAGTGCSLFGAGFLFFFLQFRAHGALGPGNCAEVAQRNLWGGGGAEERLPSQTHPL